MSYPAYTKCVSGGEYRKKNIELRPLIAAAIATLAYPIFSIPALIAGLFALEQYLDYILDKKLICLHGDAKSTCSGEDQVVVGTIVSLIDPHYSLSGLESFVDNDFGINLILFPLRLDDFVKVNDGMATDPPKYPNAKTTRFDLHRGQLTDAFFADGIPRTPQGYLVGPTPPGDYSPEADPNEGHYVSMTNPDDVKHIGGVDPSNTPPVIDIDVFHCEIEGARGHDMREAIRSTRSLGTGLCDITVFGIRVGRAFCAITMALLAPIIWARVIYASTTATPGNPRQVGVSPGDGEVKLGDVVLIWGRWVQDADVEHGWHEFHPVQAIQKLRPASRPYPTREELDVQECKRLACEVPQDYWTDTSAHGAIGFTNPPPKAAAMTPEQQRVFTAQARPENGWIIHPALDGCVADPSS